MRTFCKYGHELTVCVLFLVGYYHGKHVADEWYAKHPVVETAIVDPCPGGTFHHDHVTVYRQGPPGPIKWVVPKDKP